ncbi:MAG: hypothetical protein JKY89_07350 [Immundisolibacteraceae bacterium]|nr:hypothetical protein [Immundisolibacteraceae bacterium]
MKLCRRLVLGCFFLISWPIQAVEFLPVDFLNLIEEPLQQRLIRFQKDPGGLRPFSSDGCSGGLSTGWLMVSQVLSPINVDLNSSPSWQHCCVDHDQLYWKGGGEHGSAERLNADQQLRACVLATGQQVLLKIEDTSDSKSGPAVEVQQQIETQLQRLMPVVAELMYQAVRSGGLPCSGLSWRWGYGWPQCGVGESDPSSENE